MFLAVWYLKENYRTKSGNVRSWEKDEVIEAMQELRGRHISDLRHTTAYAVLPRGYLLHPVFEELKIGQKWVLICRKRTIGS